RSSPSVSRPRSTSAPASPGCHSGDTCPPWPSAASSGHCSTPPSAWSGGAPSRHCGTGSRPDGRDRQILVVLTAASGDAGRDEHDKNRSTDDLSRASWAGPAGGVRGPARASHRNDRRPPPRERGGGRRLLQPRGRSAGGRGRSAAAGGAAAGGATTEAARGRRERIARAGLAGGSDARRDLLTILLELGLRAR